ncbi:SH3 domain-containing protein [Gelidibacter gilvus]|uniref:Uncharacterized protein n=1 Tax=Gelidibacter gilvus TaxID=59602 RepID=A0A4Q0XHQ6_9FLAO|nr:SH3 domain-containing protein [Gelidibacter gilvus]RXJ51108.1 hypothetical protein ESZ48_04320 [Gelidibacter gilvus]
MKNQLVILFLLVISSISCNSQINSKLTIEGTNIWIREYPTTGDIIMKLNEGDVCDVLKKDKKDKIGGITDYWYKIKFNNQIGWVFGSQTSIKQNKKLIKLLKNFDIKYEEGLDIKIINKVLFHEEDVYESRILFEYTYSDKKPPLIFVYVSQESTAPYFIVVNKLINFSELKEKVSKDWSGAFSEEFSTLIPSAQIQLKANEILVDVNYDTTMYATHIYNIDGSGFITESDQNEFFINKKTTALESFDFYETQDLRKIIGNIFQGDNIIIESTISYSFFYGGIFKIRTEKGEIGWVEMELLPARPLENTPQLHDIESFAW